MNRHQRRAAEAREAQARHRIEKTPGLRLAEELADHAHQIVMSMLTTFESKPTELQMQAPYRVVGDMAMLAFRAWPHLRENERFRTERVAVTLDTGCGKTLSVVAFIAAAYHLGMLATGNLARDSEANEELGALSIVVTTSRIEDLVDIQTHLLNLGVPQSVIALQHGKRFDPNRVDEVRKSPRLAARYATVPSASDEQASAAPVLLCAQARIRMGAEQDCANIHYRGAPRSLCLWDEVCIRSTSRAIDLEALDAGVACLSKLSRVTSVIALSDALAWLAECIERLQAERDRQLGEREYAKEQRRLTGLSDPVIARRVRLPTVPDPETRFDEWVQAFEELDDKHGHDLPDLTPLLNMIANGQAYPVRVLTAGAVKNETVIAFAVTVPNSFKPVVILDASHELSRIAALDKSIGVDPWFAGKEIKRYRDVTLHVWSRGAGRGSTEKALAAAADLRSKAMASLSVEALEDLKRAGRKMVAEYIGVIRDAPANEQSLFVTFLPKHGINSERILRDALVKAGLDPDEEIEVLTDRKDRDGNAVYATVRRFGFLTHGKATATSEFRYARRVLLLGTHFLGDADVAAAIAGQRQNLLVEPTRAEITEVICAEAAATIYQEISRGYSRIVRDGEAGRMDAYLMLPGIFDKAIWDALQRRMPGVTRKDWVSEPALEQKVAREVSEFLLHVVPARVNRVPVKAAKKAIDPRGEIKETTWRTGRDLALKGDLAGDWRLHRRTLVRVGSDADVADDSDPYGTTDRRTDEVTSGADF